MLKMEKESGKISEDIRELDKDIHFYKTELFHDRPEEYVYEVRKLLSKAEEKKRHLTSKLREAEHKESVAEKNKIEK